MEILGIGASELVFIVIIALIVLGPKDMQKAGKTIGKWLRDVVTSDAWKMFQQTSRELRTLPNRLMREANHELNQIGNDLNSASNPAAPHSEPKAKRPDGAVGRSTDPKTPPRSRPIPGNKTSSSTTESEDNESDPQINA